MNNNKSDTPREANARQKERVHAAYMEVAERKGKMCTE